MKKLPFQIPSSEQARARAKDLHASFHVRLKSRPKRFWWWAASASLVGFICLILLYRLAFVIPAILEQDAFFHNRRVTIDLSSSDIVGGLHSSQSGFNETIVNAGHGASGSLNAAPYEVITESTKDGPLPKISGSLQPWEYYAKSYAAVTHYPQVAIIIADLGMHTDDIDTVLHLPSQLTFSLSPYASHVQELAERLRGLGFETMIDLPMQPSDYPYSDPGPYALLADKNEKTNLAALYQTLSRFSGYTGAVATQDEVITGSDQALSLIKEFSKRGILLIYAKNERNKRWNNQLLSNVWPAMPAEVVIDRQTDPAAIKASFKQLAEAAKQNFFAIGIIHPYPESLQSLREWLPTLEKQHVELVPVSTIAHQRYHIFDMQDDAPPAPVKKPAAGEESHGEESHEAAPAGHE